MKLKTRRVVTTRNAWNEIGLLLQKAEKIDVPADNKAGQKKISLADLNKSAQFSRATVERPVVIVFKSGARMSAKM